MPARGKGHASNRYPGAPHLQVRVSPPTRYSLNCFDPRYPLGYPVKLSDNFTDLCRLCDIENAKCVRQGSFVQFWVIADGRYVYPPEFSVEAHADEQDRNRQKLCRGGAA